MFITRFVGFPLFQLLDRDFCNFCNDEVFLNIPFPVFYIFKIPNLMNLLNFFNLKHTLYYYHIFSHSSRQNNEITTTCL